MNDLALPRPTSGVMPTLAPGGNTGSAANAEQAAAMVRAIAARYRTGFMKPVRYLAAIALTIAAACSAFAADPVFPPGARVGMTPLVGLGKARSFIGFETDDQGVRVLVTDLP